MLPGMAAGVAAGTSLLKPDWAPVQLPALALLAWTLARADGLVARLRPGFWFGASMAGVALSQIGIPGAAVGVLFAALTAYWMALGAGLAPMLRRGDKLGVLGAAGLFTLGEWAQTLLLPLFGSAQRLAGAWIEYDFMLPLARAGGTLAISFVLTALAFLAAVTASSHTLRASLRRPATATAMLLTITLGCGMLALTGHRIARGGTGAATMRIAVCASKNSTGAFMSPDHFLKKHLPPVERAAAQGARLVITPEMGLFLEAQERDAALERLASEARRLNVAWALGFAQSLPSLNRAVLLNAGKPVGDLYTKTHRVPFLEQYARDGDGAAVTGLVDGVRVGLMICQDDNFEDVARNLGLAGAQIVAVPTFDWPGVEHAHLHSARNRPREHGFALARAALGGVSAILDGSGRPVATRNHLLDGDGFALADVPVGDGAPTPFARFGNAPVLALAAALASAAAVRRRRLPAAETRTIR